MKRFTINGLAAAFLVAGNNGVDERRPSQSTP